MVHRFALAVLLAAAAPLAQARVAVAGESHNEIKLPDLLVGSPAPALSIGKWLKGNPVASFEKGKVYMVEFWATWCGPCIASIPHLAELQKKYADRGFTLVSVTSEDPRNPLEKVEKFLGARFDQMAYTVAWDNGQQTKGAFFHAAGQRGIPCAFLIDGNGRIAYIGHPMQIDQTLEEVVAGKHDIRALAEKYKRKLSNEAKAQGLQQGLNEAFQKEDWAKALEHCDALLALDAEEFSGVIPAKFMILGSKLGDYDKAYAYARECHGGAAKHNAMLLNALAWTIVDPEGGFQKRDLELALALAGDANKLSGEKEPNVLDTLARVYFQRGDAGRAVELQTRAVELAPKGQQAGLQKSLEEYRAALSKQGGS
jgi:thiol-disulfide isomerase/thioredoxin